MANASHVSTGKPLVGGAIYRAPLGASLPTSATEELDLAFESLGFVSDDGVTNGTSFESSEIKAWGGSTVMTSVTGRKDTFGFKLIESMSPETLRVVFGDDNVIGTDIASGYTVKSNMAAPEPASWVIDLALNSGALKRIVIPKAAISEFGDIVYKDDEAIGYEITITAVPDESDNTHYEYIYRAPSTACKLTRFMVAGVRAVINETAKTVAVTVPHGTTVTALKAIFNISPLASVKVGNTEQVSGVTENDFTNPVSYVVTAEDGTTSATYVVTVTVADEAE